MGQSSVPPDRRAIVPPGTFTQGKSFEQRRLEQALRSPMVKGEDPFDSVQSPSANDAADHDNQEGKLVFFHKSIAQDPDFRYLLTPEEQHDLDEYYKPPPPPNPSCPRCGWKLNEKMDDVVWKCSDCGLLFKAENAEDNHNT